MDAPRHLLPRSRKRYWSSLFKFRLLHISLDESHIRHNIEYVLSILGWFCFRFDAVIISSEVGYEKPDDKIFRAALGKF